jgi:LPS sulfotransferase NodH
VLAWPLASLGTCPRDPLGGAALGEMKPVDESDEETKSSPAERMAPMRRALGGRTRVIYVRVTEEEDREIRRRAVKHRRSAQRFLIETALSGSARLSAERSRAQRDAEMARIGLARLANNVNQLAKWANTNHAMPTDFGLDDLIHDLGRAVDSVEQTVVSLGTAFGVGRRGSDGE